MAIQILYFDQLSVQKGKKKRTEQYLQKSENRCDTLQNLKERMFRENSFVKHILIKKKMRKNKLRLSYKK